MLPEFEGILDMLQSSLKTIVDGMTVAIAGMQAGQPLMEQELSLSLTEIVPIFRSMFTLCNSST